MTSIFVLFILTCVSAAAFILSVYQRAERMGSQMQPLTADERLRLSLVLRQLEEAEAELLKVHDGGKGHPAVLDLSLDIQEVQAQIRRVMRTFR